MNAKEDLISIGLFTIVCLACYAAIRLSTSSGFVAKYLFMYIYQVMVVILGTLTLMPSQEKEEYFSPLCFKLHLHIDASCENGNHLSASQKMIFLYVCGWEIADWIIHGPLFVNTMKLENHIHHSLHLIAYLGVCMIDRCGDVFMMHLILTGLGGGLIYPIIRLLAFKIKENTSNADSGNQPSFGFFLRALPLADSFIYTIFTLSLWWFAYNIILAGSVPMIFKSCITIYCGVVGFWLRGRISFARKLKKSISTITTIGRRSSIFSKFRNSSAINATRSGDEDVPKNKATPFFQAAPELEKLLSVPDFNKARQWELPTVDFQSLTQKRLRYLAKTGAFKISQCPGMEDPLHPNEPGAFTKLLEAFHFVGMYDISLFDVVGVHVIGGIVLFIHGSSSQLAENRERIDTISDVYCFGGTELGHGSNLKQVQTIAEFDNANKKFILKTPIVAASKYWIGNSTFVGDYVVVLSRIFVDGLERGVGWLRVPLWRETETGCKERYPGVEVRDIGTKAGCNGIGNGCIQFHNVVLPTDALLMQFCQVDEDGKFQSKLNSDELFLRSIQTFVLERIGVATAAIGSAKMAIYIALRYAAARHQFGPVGSTEVQLISYPMHRRRLMSHASRLFVAKALVNRIGRNAETNLFSST